jgi:hypothetical protein
MSIDVDEQAMGRLLRLPVTSVPGETAALRTEVVQVLSRGYGALVDEMAGAVRRAGLARVLETGGVALERRLAEAARMVIAAWADRRPLHADELDALGRIGTEVGRAGIPLWRLLNGVQVAARAGWDWCVEQAVAVVEESPRPCLAARLVGELSMEMMEVVGRIEARLAAGYGDVLPPRRLGPAEQLRA